MASGPIFADLAQLGEQIEAYPPDPAARIARISTVSGSNESQGRRSSNPSIFSATRTDRELSENTRKNGKRSTFQGGKERNSSWKISLSLTGFLLGAPAACTMRGDPRHRDLRGLRQGVRLTLCGTAGPRLPLRLRFQPVEESPDRRARHRIRRGHGIVGEGGGPWPVERERQASGGDLVGGIDVAHQRDALTGNRRADEQQVVGVGRAALSARIRAARSDARHTRKRLSVAMIRDHLDIGIDAGTTRHLWRVAVHEAGHAVAGTALRLGTFTRMMISDQGGEITRRPGAMEGLLSELEAGIAYDLAGRAAERLVLGTISAGAGGFERCDLARATRSALDIEAIHGLGCEGPVWRGEGKALLLRDPAIRARVRQRIERAERRADEILARHREPLEALALDLLHRRSMGAAEIRRWLHDIPAWSDAAPPVATGEDRGEITVRVD